MIRRISDAAQAARQKAMEAAREAARKAAEAARKKAAEAARKAAEAARQRDAFERAKAQPKPVEQAKPKPVEAKKDVVSEKVKEKVDTAPSVARQIEQTLDVKGEAKVKDGKASVGVSADATRKTTFQPKAQADKAEAEAKAKEEAGDAEPAEKSRANKTLDVLGQAGGVLSAAGLSKTWEGQSWDSTGRDQLSGDKVSFAGGLAGTYGSQSLTVGADGVEGKFERGAVAGLYAQKNDRIEGAHGSAAYQVGAKVEAEAKVDGDVKLDTNGLEANVNASVGVRAEASASGQLETRPLTVSGVELTAGVSGNAKVSAEAEAHATGKVAVTRDPPTAIAEGEVGASAVAKAEADVTVDAGPFSVTASGYVSAGAEASAGGTIGFEDGKLKIGGKIGAALGVGAGGSAQVEVDVAMIGEMAKNAADVDGDGKLGLGDVKAGAQALGNAAVNLGDRDGDGKLGLSDVKAGAEQLAGGVRDAVDNARDVIGGAVSEARDRVANKVTEVASNVVEGAKDTVKDAGKKVASFFGF